MSEAQAAFNAIFKNVENEVEFKEEWKNGTGYMDGIVHDKQFEKGVVYKTVTGIDRRVLIVGTRFGAIAAFERYAPKGESRSMFIVGNVPVKLKGFLPTSTWSEDDLYRCFSFDENFSDILEQLLEFVVLK